MTQSQKKAKKPPNSGSRVSRTHKPDDLGLEQWQRLIRKQYAETQEFKLENLGGHPVISEFLLTNPASGNTYKIAVRGLAPGDNYCSCPDYSINSLGTCKHIEFTLAKLLKKRGGKKVLQEGRVLPFSEVYLSYGLIRQLRFRAGQDPPDGLMALSGRFFDAGGALKEERLLDFHQFVDRAIGWPGHEVRIYDDALSFIAGHQDARWRLSGLEEMLKKGDGCVFDGLLNTELYPYQQDGVLFATRAGRCLIGDEMGLGKTVQALAAAELMARLFKIQKVLVVSPASLKYQWQTEIGSFSGRAAQVMEGPRRRREEQYRRQSFYKLVNYELVFRDLDLIHEWKPDLIILDEAQRIKNWKTRTAQSVKQLESTFAIVLTGTPLENRIEELHSIVEFIDRYHFGPLYRFVHNHRILDEDGKMTGYRNLKGVRDSLKDVMIRRKKEDVLSQLPERIDKNFIVPMTPEQLVIHDENKEIVARLAAKWRRYRFLNEVDQRRLQIALNYMRMAAVNTYLVDKKTIHGPKLDELEMILKEVVLEDGEKVVIFSQWLRMAELIERMLERNGIGYAYLNGSVSSRERALLISRFREDPACSVFLSTDAGGVGLNLQSGSVVINMDIPWNPAILEQRIGRVHRLGQSKAVRIINFISASSIEERMLELLKFKKSLFAGVLDEGGEDIILLEEPRLNKLMRSVETVVEALDEAKMSEAADGAAKSETQGQGSQGQVQDNKGQVRSSHAQVQHSEDHARDSEAQGQSGEAQAQEFLGQLITGGIQLLARLSENAREQGLDKGAVDRDTIIDQSGINQCLEDFVRKDEETGETYMRLTLPEPERIKDIFSALGDLVSGAMRNRKGREQ